MEPWKEELYHHGILGMKWGKRNGPPYPLGAGDHSTSEKKAGWRKSLDGGSGSSGRRASSKQIDDLKTKRGTARSGGGRSKKEISEHRSKMVQKYTNSGNKDMAELYKNATDEQIAKDIQHKENVKKAIMYGAAAVGIAAASYLVYKNLVVSNTQVAQAVQNAGVTPTIDILQKNGVSLNTASKIVEISKTSDLSDRKIITKISNEIQFNDMDISLEKGYKLTRIDFHKDFDMSAVGKNPLFVTMNKIDNDIYKRVLPNRTGLKDGRFEVLLEGKKAIKAPSYQKTEKIISNLIAKDPNFKNQIRDNISDMIQKNLKAQGMNVSPQQLQYIVDQNIKLLSKKGDAYVAITALGGNASSDMKSKLAKEFIKNGYDAVVDMHDVKDGLSNIPLIMLNNNALVKIGQKKIANI